MISKYFKEHTIQWTITFVMVCSLFSAGCSAYRTSHTPGLKKVKIVYSLPILKPDGELQNIADSFMVVSYKNMILYQFPYTSTKENAHEVLSNKIVFACFIHERNKKTGYYYDSLGAGTYNRQIPVDSLLALKAFAGTNFYDHKNDSLVDVFKDPKSSIVREKYIPKVKYDQSYGDTTFFYYSGGLKNIDYSFSRQLDSIKQLKLFKVRISYNAQFYKGYSFKFPEREYLFELKEEAVANSKEIIDFFDRFKKNSDQK